MLQWTIASWLLGVNEKMPQWADAHPPPIGDAGARAEADRPMQRRATGGGLAVGFTERSGRELDAHLCVLGAERAPPLGAVRSEGELGLGGGGRMCDWWSDLEAGRPPAWQAPSLAESLSACSAPATLARPAARAPHRAAEERAPLRSRPSALGHIRASASLAAIPTQPPGLAMHDECAVARSVSLSYALRPATPPLPLRQASGESSSASSPALSDQMPSLFGIADGERFMLVRPSASDSSGSDEPVEERAAAAPRRASALLGASARTLSNDKGEWQGVWQGDWLGAARQPRLEPQPPSARSVACGASQAGVDLELAAAPAHAAGGGLIRMVTPTPARARSAGRLARALRWARKADYYARQFFKPAVVATILGVAVGLTPRLKALLVPAPTAPLYWLLEGVSTVGDAAVPLNLMLLGASLSKGPSWAQISLRANVGIVLAKMVLMPLLAAGADDRRPTHMHDAINARLVRSAPTPASLALCPARPLLGPRDAMQGSSSCLRAGPRLTRTPATRSGSSRWSSQRRRRLTTCSSCATRPGRARTRWPPRSSRSTWSRPSCCPARLRCSSSSSRPPSKHGGQAAECQRYI